MQLAATGNTYIVAVNGSATPGTHALEVSSIASIQFSMPGTTVTMTCSSGSTGTGSGSVATAGSSVLDVVQTDGLQLNSCVLGPWVTR